MQIYKFKSLLSFQLDCFYNVQLIKILEKKVSYNEYLLE